jgi:protein deglycase
MPTVLVPLAEGFEELELVAPVDMLRRAGCTVTLAALGPSLLVTGRNALVLQADQLLGSAPAAERPLADCLLLPGGPGVARLRADATVRALVTRHAAAGRLLAAICAAPLVLHDAGLLQGRRFTAHPSAAAELPPHDAGQRVVQDGQLLTARGAGPALDFGLALVTALCGPEKSAEIAAAIRV